MLLICIALVFFGGSCFIPAAQLYVDLICARALKIQGAASKLVAEVCRSLTVPAPDAAFEVATAGSFDAAGSFEEASGGQSGGSAGVPGPRQHGPSWAPTPDGLGAAVVAEVRVSLMSRAAVEARFVHEVAALGDDAAWPTDADAGWTPADGCGDQRMRAAALRVCDALTLNVVLPEAVYAEAALVLRARLCARPELTEVSTSVGWASPVQLHAGGHCGAGGVRIILEQPGEDDGVAFTPDDAYPVAVQLHTPASLQAAVGIAAAWSEFQSANLPSQRVAALSKARALASRTPLPPGAEYVAVEFERA